MLQMMELLIKTRQDSIFPAHVRNIATVEQLPSYANSPNHTNKIREPLRP